MTTQHGVASINDVIPVTELTDRPGSGEHNNVLSPVRDLDREPAAAACSSRPRFSGQFEQMQPISASALIALVGPDDTHRTLLRPRLDLMGHASLAFDTIEGFMVALCAGRRFDLLVLVRPSDAIGDRLALLRDTAATPMLLVIELPDLLDVPNRDFLVGNNIDFVASSADGQKFEWSVRGLLARFGTGVSAVLKKNEVVYGDFRFLVPQRVVTVRDGRQIHLKPREFELALQLFLNVGRLLPRDWLWSMLWGRVPRADDRSLDVCVAGVRRALNLRAENGLVLSAIYGRGYRLDTIL